jgi:hypothetical protein
MLYTVYVTNIGPLAMRVDPSGKDRNCRIRDLKSGHESRKGLDIKTDRLPGRQL